MGFVSSLKQRFFSSQPVKTSVQYTGEPGFWQRFGLPSATNSGKNVTPEMALGVGVVYACIYKIASTLASLPLNVYADNGATFDIIDNSASYLLNKTPDERCTAFEFRETMIFSMLLFGTGYAEITR